MGQVIRFPFERRLSSNRAERHRLPEGSATIIILPVVRIERHAVPEKAPRLGRHVSPGRRSKT